MTPDADKGDAATRSIIDRLPALGNSLVEISAVFALAWVAQSGASEATVQVVAGAIASVAIGKRYLAGKVGGGA